MKKILKPAIIISILLLINIPNSVKAKTVFCKLTRLACRQKIEGTSADPPKTPKKSEVLETYESKVSGGSGYRTYLYLNTDFNEEEKKKIQIGLGIGWAYTNPEREEDFKSCIRKYAKNSLFPINEKFSPRLSNDFADNLVGLLKMTDKKDLKVNKLILQQPPKPSIILGRATVNYNWIKNGFLISMTPESLSEPVGNPRMTQWGSTIIHEMMHNLGYDHPKKVKDIKDFRGNLLYEATWCINRGNKDDPERSNLQIPLDSNTSENKYLFVD